MSIKAGLIGYGNIAADYHAEYSLMAICAGKHVVVKKPMGKNSAELLPLVDAARENDVLLTVHHNRRWDPGFRTIKHVLRFN
jgi:scyllo-inositol 2-dehydrogenase (NADP+)